MSRVGAPARFFLPGPSPTANFVVLVRSQVWSLGFVGIRSPPRAVYRAKCEVSKVPTVRQGMQLRKSPDACSRQAQSLLPRSVVVPPGSPPVNAQSSATNMLHRS